MLSLRSGLFGRTDPIDAGWGLARRFKTLPETPLHHVFLNIADGNAFILEGMTVLRLQSTFANALAALFLLLTVPAAAENYYVAPSPNASDTNDCLGRATPCATFQHAADLCPRGGHCDIEAAPGVYSQKTNVFYYKVISIIGNCADRAAVIVDDRINGVGEAGAIFMVQDHAILTISCMSLAAYAGGSAGFSARQFAIGDVAQVDFGQFAGAAGVTAYETSKINIRSPGIYGNASRFAQAADLSQVTIGGAVKIADGLTFDVAFLSSLFGSVVSMYPTAMEGGKAMSGASYQCADAIVKTSVPLPGGNVPYSDNENCNVFGIASDREILDDSRLRAIRTEFVDSLRRAEKKQRQRDRLLYGLIAGLAVLTLVAMGSVLYRVRKLVAGPR